MIEVPAAARLGYNTVEDLIHFGSIRVYAMISAYEMLASVCGKETKSTVDMGNILELSITLESGGLELKNSLIPSHIRKKFKLLSQDIAGWDAMRFDKYFSRIEKIIECKNISGDVNCTNVAGKIARLGMYNQHLISGEVTYQLRIGENSHVSNEGRQLLNNTLKMIAPAYPGVNFGEVVEVSESVNFEAMFTMVELQQIMKYINLLKAPSPRQYKRRDFVNRFHATVQHVKNIPKPDIVDTFQDLMAGSGHLDGVPGCGKTIAVADTCLALFEAQKILIVMNSQSAYEQYINAFKYVYSNEKFETLKIQHIVHRSDVVDATADVVFTTYHVSNLENFGASITEDHFDICFIDEAHNVSTQGYRFNEKSGSDSDYRFQLLEILKSYSRHTIFLSGTNGRAEHVDDAQICKVTHTEMKKIGAHCTINVQLAKVSANIEIRAKQFTRQIVSNGRRNFAVFADRVSELDLLYTTLLDDADCDDINIYRYYNDNDEIPPHDLDDTCRNIILSIDQFSENVDVPKIDTVVFLNEGTYYTSPRRTGQRVGRGGRNEGMPDVLVILPFYDNPISPGICNAIGSIAHYFDLQIDDMMPELVVCAQPLVIRSSASTSSPPLCAAHDDAESSLIHQTTDIMNAFFLVPANFADILTNVNTLLIAERTNGDMKKKTGTKRKHDDVIAAPKPAKMTMLEKLWKVNEVLI